MGRRTGWRAGLWLVLAGLAAGQDPATREVPLRVTAVQPGGWVGVDRGENEGLARGQRVRFQPRQGGRIEGTIDATAERTAVVVLDRKNVSLDPGTPGVAFVPVHPEAPPDEPQVEQGAGGAEGPDLGEWTDDMPLLARIGAVDPADRPRRWTLRNTVSFDHITSDNDRSDSFFRTGVDYRLENGWGRGGSLHLDVEFNARDYESLYSEGESTSTLRVDRASYSLGGTRFRDHQLVFGRFLQLVPELGILDGVAGEQRFANGNRLGVSLGFQPENDPELHSAEDLQVASWYRWTSDESERFAITGAAQQTWHNGTPDRQLLLGKLHWFPQEGWDVTASAWLDLYDGDDQKSEVVDLTQAYASASRRWEDGRGMTFGLTRWRFADLDRDEYWGLGPDTLEEGGLDRLSWDGWRPIQEDRTALAHLSLWSGDGETGGLAEIGLRFHELWHDEGEGTAQLFLGSGSFEDRRGLRLAYDRFTSRGYWTLSYELTNYSVDGFDADADDLLHHRLRGTRTLDDVWGWHVSTYADVSHEDTESAFAFGIQLTRGF